MSKGKKGKKQRAKQLNRVCIVCGKGLTGRQRRLCSDECYRERRNERVREYYQRNRERILEKRKEYYRNNRGKISEKMREYYQKNRERILKSQREYYQRNPEKLSEIRHQRYQSNREKILKYRHEHYLNNRGRILERSREYRQKNLGKLRERDHKYYQNNRERILEKQKEYGCEYRLKNREKVKERHSEYYQNNLERLREQGHQKYRLSRGLPEDWDLSRESSIEIIMRRWLQESDIGFIQHHFIDLENSTWTRVDFYIPEANVCLYCDGDYWHGPEKPDTQECDTKINKALEAQRYSVVRMTETEILEGNRPWWIGELIPAKW